MQRLESLQAQKDELQALEEKLGQLREIKERLVSRRSDHLHQASLDTATHAESHARVQQGSLANE